MSDTFSNAATGSRAWTIALWCAQVALAVLFGMAGAMHIFMSPDALAAMGVAWPQAVPIALVRFVGLCELAGALGVILPAATRIKPSLTPLAALGFTAIQCLAIPLHIMRGEIATTAVANILLLSLSLFVLWGRTRKAPIQPR